MSKFLKDQWNKYRRRKTKFGIISDFLFFALLIGMIIPDSRRIISSTVIRYTMMQPKENNDLIFVTKDDLNWKLISEDGKQVSPSQSFGKPIFINFWATWCPPCIAEMPSIQSFYDKYRDRVDFYLISNENIALMKKHLKKRELTLPVYSLASPVSGKFKSRKIPTSFLISPEGKIVMIKQGAADWDGSKVFSIVDKMLSKENTKH
ncbi:MAG: TlpA family protein disulfide reductase [Chlorobi bacterium]|nr:TlpA family protein disulfide reductase [Chlorobiota bacterium]